MSDSVRTQDLEKEIEQLNEELEEYCWNIRELQEGEKQDIRNLYRLWKTSINKKIVISDLHKTNVRVSSDILSNKEVLWHSIKQDHSLHFLNCSDITIIVNPKVNHITIERCKNVNIRVVNGSISGIDFIKCDNVTSVFNSKNVNFMDISDCTQCLFILSERVAKDIVITVTSAFNINFRIVCSLTGITRNNYRTNMNVFQNSTMYSFKPDDKDELSLYMSNNFFSLS